MEFGKRIGLNILKRKTAFLPRRFLQFDSHDLKSTLESRIPAEKDRIRSLKEKYGSAQIGNVTVDMLYNGMRSMNALVCETSSLDPEEGIRFRGYTLYECLDLLPRSPGGLQPLPEAMFWLLMTGDMPSDAQVRSLSEEWSERATLPEYFYRVFRSIPPEVHPMRQFSSAITILGNDSKFNSAYRKGIDKSSYWEYTYEDSMDLIARLPIVAGMIYNNILGKKSIGYSDRSGDWTESFTRMLGFSDGDFAELMRLYLTIHSDHESGNVSAHTVHLVGSALSDPYLALASGLNGLAGPLHGLANQEVMIWLEELQNSIGTDPSEDKLKEYVLKIFNRGKVIPGYGHAVLRKTDPRYSCQREFALKYMSEDPLFKIADRLYKIVPPILIDSKKVKNPWPNVDAISGVLLQHYGMKEKTFYTVLFGLSRSLGVLSQLIWSRALGFPIERPKSISTERLMNMLNR